MSIERPPFVMLTTPEEARKWLTKLGYEGPEDIQATHSHFLRALQRVSCREEPAELNEVMDELRAVDGITESTPEQS